MVFEGKQLFFSRSLEIEAPSYSETYELERAHDDAHHSHLPTETYCPSSNPALEGEEYGAEIGTLLTTIWETQQTELL